MLKLALLTLNHTAESLAQAHAFNLDSHPGYVILLRRVPGWLDYNTLETITKPSPLPSPNSPRLRKSKTCGSEQEEIHSRPVS